MAAKPPTVVEMTWIEDLRFAVRLRETELVIDSRGTAGPSPVEALGVALSGCMSIDVRHILARGRHQVRSLTSKLVAERAPEDPHRIVSVSLHFSVAGILAPGAIERAITLSRDKYCSVWHSMRHDIPFHVTFDVVP